MSQLVPDMPRERPVIQRGNPQNDASMWIGGVVSSDDFAPTAKKRAPAKSRKRLWAIVGLVVVAVAGGAVGYLALRDDAPATTASATPSPAATPAPSPAPAPPTAAVAAPAVPAAAPTVAAAAPLDAGVVQPTVAADPAMVVDAISQVGAPIKAKAVKKKKVAKKKAATKKAAPAPKRR